MQCLVVEKLSAGAVLILTFIVCVSSVVNFILYLGTLIVILGTARGRLTTTTVGSSGVRSSSAAGFNGSGDNGRSSSSRGDNLGALVFLGND